MLAFVTMVLAAEPRPVDLYGTWEVRRTLERTTCELSRLLEDDAPQVAETWTIAPNADGALMAAGWAIAIRSPELALSRGYDRAWLTWAPGRMTGQELGMLTTSGRSRFGVAYMETCASSWRLELTRAP